MSIFYCLLFAISFFYLFLLLFRFRESISVCYYLLSVCILLINYGYWQISIAVTLEEALSACRIRYLGSAFVSYFMVRSIAQLTKTKIPPVIEVLALFLGTAVTILSMTIGRLPVYYKSAQLIQTGWHAYLMKEYGPMHVLFVAEVVLMLGYGLWMVVGALTEKKKVSYISSICSLAVMLTVVVLYFVEGDRYPLLPVAYDLGFAIVLVLLNRIRLYNTIGLSKESQKESREYGFVAFDAQGRFLDADAMARHWFPELNGLDIDRPISDFSTDFLRQAANWINRRDNETVRRFTCGDRIIEAKRSLLSIRRNRQTLCIQLRDDTEQQTYARHIEHDKKNLQHDVAVKARKIEQIQNDIIISMAGLVENRDANTGGHILRTSEIVRVFVDDLMDNGSLPQLSHRMADCIIRSAPLHDLGKIGVSDAVLNKPGRFTPEEYEEMKKHPVLGNAVVKQILQNADDVMFKTVAENIAHYHHERWDGSGYPEGRKGEEIPLEARIMALADVLDALVSKRVYKEKFSFDKAFSIIRESGGSHFDPFLCEQFLACRDRLIAVCSSHAEE